MRSVEKEEANLKNEIVQAKVKDQNEFKELQRTINIANQMIC